jgi:hypothetical protein
MAGPGQEQRSGFAFEDLEARLAADHGRFAWQSCICIKEFVSLEAYKPCREGPRKIGSKTHEGVFDPFLV